MKRFLLALTLVPLVLTGCKKETPPPTLEELAALVEADLKVNPRQHCLRTGMLGFMKDGSAWLTYTEDSLQAPKVITDDFKNQLTLLEEKGWLRIQRYTSNIGEFSKVYFTDVARQRFGIKDRHPVRQDQVQELCISTEKLGLLETLGPMEVINGVPRQLVSFKLVPTELPAWAKDRELDTLVWARYPDAPNTGTARFYVKDGVWTLDPNWIPRGKFGMGVVGASTSTP